MYKRGNGLNKSFLNCIIRSFINPFSTILFFLALISFVTEILLKENNRNFFTSLIILVMLVISGVIRLAQELSSKKIIDKLLKLVNNEEFKNLKIGDVITLKVGDRIPADIKIVESKYFWVSEAIITGESAIVEKKQDDIVYMGTTVVGGTCIGKVIALGKNTLYGALSLNKISYKRRFNEGAKSISMVLIKFMIILVPIVFILTSLRHGTLIRSFIFSLSVAIGLTPELLPMVISACLAKASFFMGKKGIVVKNVNAMQVLGSIDMLCVDKTGTLTNDKVFLEYYIDILGNECRKVLDYAYINSYYHTGYKNHLDTAILEYKNEYYDKLLKNILKIDEIPFDSGNKYSSVLISYLGENIEIIKGDLEQVINKCTKIEYKDTIKDIDDNKLNSVYNIVSELTEDGMKVLAVAYKKENEYILLGYLAFFDTPKSTAYSSIEKLHNLNIDIRILTGDSLGTSISVCKRLGINYENVLTGKTLEKLDKNELYIKVEKTTVFAELTPKQKARIIEILKENGHSVGFLADGMNDMQASLVSDVSISVSNATEALKDSSDIILLKKDLNILEEGIIEGRKAFINMNKYIKITASSNFGNICAVVCSSLILPFYPITAIQILILNILYDTLCLVLPFDNVDESLLKEPSHWSGKTLSRFMIYFGPISLIFDFLTFIFLYYILAPSMLNSYYSNIGALKQEFISIFQTGWFLETMWTQVLIIHMLRTEKLPFVKEKPSLVVTVTTVLGVILLSILTISPLGKFLGFTRLKLSYYIFLILIVGLYMLIISIAKIVYIRKYKKLL